MISISRNGLRALALAALFVTPAAAQSLPSVGMMPETKSKTPEEKERDERADKAYRESLRKIPDAKSVSDPWSDMRGAEAAKAPPKPKTAAPKRAKADISGN